MAREQAQKAGLVLRSLTALPPLPGPDGAAAHYATALAYCAQGSRSPYAPTEPGAKWADEGLVKVRKSARIYDEIEAACAQKDCDFRVSGGEEVDSSTLELLVRLLCLRAITRAHQGEYASAGADIGRIATITRHIMGRASEVDLTSAGDFVAAASRACQIILSNERGNAACAAALQSGMAGFPDRLEVGKTVAWQATQLYGLFAAEDPKSLFAGRRGPYATPTYDQFRSVVAGIDPAVACGAAEARLLQFFTAIYLAACNPKLTDLQREDAVNAIWDAEEMADSTHVFNQLMADPRYLSDQLRYDASLLVTRLGLRYMANPAGGTLFLAGKRDPFSDEALAVTHKGSRFEVASTGPSEGKWISFTYPLEG